MRKVFIAATLGLASLGSSIQPASAARNCLHDAGVCYEKLRGAGYNTLTTANVCWDRKVICERDNAAEGYSPNGTKVGESGGGGSGPGGSGSGDSKPKPGTPRTANGSTVMVTPKGREWVWNGKYNTVVDYANGYVVRSHSVMQGDPDAPMQKVDGKYIRQSDPGYEAAVDAEKAKNNVVVHDHRTPQPKATPPASGTPTKFGAAQGAASGQASSSATAVPTTTTTTTGVRDHRDATNGGAANGTPTIPPAITAAGIDKRPGRNAQ